MRRIHDAWAVLILLASLAVLPVLAAVVTQTVDVIPDPVTACWTSELPDGVREGDNTLRSVEVTAVPAGRHCAWEQGVSQTGWPVTVAALIGTGAAVIASALAFLARGARRKSLSILPVAVVALGWLILWAQQVYIID